MTDKQFYQRLVRELGERRYRTIPGAVQVRQTIDLVIGAIEAALEGEPRCRCTNPVPMTGLRTGKKRCQTCREVI